MKRLYQTRQSLFPPVSFSPLLSPITLPAFKRHWRSTACHKRPAAERARELSQFLEKLKLFTFRKCYFPTDHHNHERLYQTECIMATDVGRDGSGNKLNWNNNSPELVIKANAVLLKRPYYAPFYKVLVGFVEKQITFHIFHIVAGPQ